jgi:type IV secretion system protein VirB11
MNLPAADSAIVKAAGPMVAAELPYDRSVTVRSLMNATGLSAFMALDGVTEVTVNRPGEVWTESREGWIRYAAPGCTLDLLMKLANALVILNGGHLSAADPIHPVRLPDGHRGQVVIPPAVEPDTVSITIRIPAAVRLSMDDYVRGGSLGGFTDASPELGITPTFGSARSGGLQFTDVRDASPAGEVKAGVPAGVPVEALQGFELDMLREKSERNMPRFLQLAIENRLNIVTVGGVGSGKTTLMKALADMVPAHTRVGTIEDTHELSLPHHPNRVHLFYSDTLPAKEIVRSTLRMKFDRVFLAELRGDETWDYLTLLNTGHQGGMTSVHANDCVSAFSRLATLIKASPVGQTLDWHYLLREVHMTIDVVLFMEHKRLKEVFYDPVGKWKLQRGLA